MNLILLKVDDIDEEKDFKIIKIPTGGIVFTHKGHTIQSLEPVQLKMTHRAIYSELPKRCKVVPFYRSVDERELIAMEYEGVNKQMVGV